MSAVEPRAIIAAFRCHGLSLQQGVLSLIQSHLSKQARLAKHNASSSKQLLQELVAKVKQAIAGRASASSVVDAELLQLALCSLQQHSRVEVSDAVLHVSALQTARFQFDPHSRRFLPLPASPPLLAPARCKTALLHDRYQLIAQRVLSHPAFSSSSASAFSLSSLSTLAGTAHRHNVLGLLVTGSDGRLMLEDASGSVCLSWAAGFQYGDGFYTEGAFVLCEGAMSEEDEATFLCSSLLMPPVERRQLTERLHRELRLLDDGEDERLRLLLQEREDDMLAALSDVWLDQPAVIARLHTMFRAFNDGTPPAVIVLAGAFLSTSSAASGGASSLPSLLDALGDVIASYPRLNSSTQFVLIPAASDTPFGPVLPCPALLSASHHLSSKVRHLLLAGNPHRLRYFHRQLVFFRRNGLQLMRRHALLSPNAATDDAASAASPPAECRHYVTTLLSQAHLSPVHAGGLSCVLGLRRRAQPVPRAGRAVPAGRLRGLRAGERRLSVRGGRQLRQDGQLRRLLPGQQQARAQQGLTWTAL